MISKIIEEIYTDKNYTKAIKNICVRNRTPQYIDDLKQEIFLILLEKDSDLIINLYNKKELLKYFCQIAYNQITNNNSPFALHIRDKRRTKIKYEESEYFNEYMVIHSETATILEKEDIQEEQNDVDHLNILNYVKQNKFLTHMEMELFIYYYNLDQSFIEQICSKRSYRYLADELGFSRSFVQKTMKNIKEKVINNLKNDPIYSKLIQI